MHLEDVLLLALFCGDECQQCLKMGAAAARSHHVTNYQGVEFKTPLPHIAPGRFLLTTLVKSVCVSEMKLIATSIMHAKALLNAVCLDAQRRFDPCITATTSLARWLDNHPHTRWVANPRRPKQIEQTGVKEAHVFDDPPKWGKDATQVPKWRPPGYGHTVLLPMVRKIIYDGCATRCQIHLLLLATKGCCSVSLRAIPLASC